MKFQVPGKSVAGSKIFADKNIFRTFCPSVFLNNRLSDRSTFCQFVFGDPHSVVKRKKNVFFGCVQKKRNMVFLAHLITPMME